ncbi:MAG: valine--tRNA ligase [Alphaproteobacteria bacterium]|nr:valine--tRNA ligase [Alphaproteobacteria bacterium]
MAYKAEQKLDDKYDHKTIENRCMEFWEREQVYKFDPSKTRAETFAIDTPPPTISGSLHIGHIYGYSQADIGVRYQRMQGKNIFFPIGWDDNGLPTERRVQINYNIKCDPSLPYDPAFKPALEFDKPMQPVSRQNFIEICREMIAKDSKVFEGIMRNVGFSYDWSLMYSTISLDAVRLAQESFIKLYKSGNVKSVEAPTMWDTQFQTAVAQAELEDRETLGNFHDIKFKCGGDEFVIATTRPELLPACIAVVAHPDDERYKKFFGKTAKTPLFNMEVPVMPSIHANPEKGTGILMVCTFGDQDDVNFWKANQQQLPLRQIIGKDGRIFGVDGFDGLSVKQARKKIVEMLRESGDLAGEPKPIMHAVKFYEKGDLPIEFVSSRQWFVSMLDKKQMMIDSAHKIKWTPEHMKTRFINWAEGINQDWLISRQRFFGVPFPVWYKLDNDGNPVYDEPIFAAELPCDPAFQVPSGYDESQRGKPNGFMGEPDVVDTWATSALTPAIAMAKTDAKNLGLPFDARWSGHDIIRTWDFYTVLVTMMNDGGKLPWNELWINGFVLDPDRKKMSKSKGNVVVPQHLVDKFGADAIRIWAASAKWGTDGIADENVMDQKRKLVMKFFNAAKFVYGFAGETKDIKMSASDNPVDLAYLAQLEKSIKEADRYFKQNDHTGALIATEQAFWDFCDNYLEIVKGRAYAGDESALKSLRFAIDIFCAMFAPFMPFITEEVWQAHPNKEKFGSLSIHKYRYPTMWIDFADDNLRVWKNAEGFEDLCELVSYVRGEKSKNNFSMKKGIAKLVVKQSAFLKSAEADIKNVLNVSYLNFEGEELVGKLIWAEDQ